MAFSMLRLYLNFLTNRYHLQQQAVSDFNFMQISRAFRNIFPHFISKKWNECNFQKKNWVPQDHFSFPYDYSSMFLINLTLSKFEKLWFLLALVIKLLCYVIIHSNIMLYPLKMFLLINRLFPSTTGVKELEIFNKEVTHDV